MHHKREIGKWFMDVAKYIATAVLLTQIFGGMADSTYIIIYALMSVVIIFALGVSIFEIAFCWYRLAQSKVTANSFEGADS